MIHDPIPRGVQSALPLFDEEALDIADYLEAGMLADDITPTRRAARGWPR